MKRNFSTDHNIKDKTISKIIEGATCQQLNPETNLNQKDIKHGDRLPAQSTAKDKLLIDQLSKTTVYIPDLFFDVPDSELEKTIKSRLQTTNCINALSVRCDSTIGVGIIQLSNEDDKTRLITHIQRIDLSTDSKIQISFVDEIEFISYIVFQNQNDLPTSETISDRWSELLKSHRRPVFEVLSVGFPHIFKITSYSIDELKSAILHDIISIKHQVGHIHAQRNCSFLENLPSDLISKGPDYLFACIVTQSEMPKQARLDHHTCKKKADELFAKMSNPSAELKKLRSFFYIQFNKETSTVIILASNSQRKWLDMECVSVGDSFVFKQSSIAFRLIIGPVPADLNLETISKQRIFQKSIKTGTAQFVGENLIVELTDKKVYEQCLTTEVLQVKHKGNRLTLSLQSYRALDNLDGSEFTVENWYGTHMLEYIDRKVDIGQFDPKNAIFRLKWNAKIWLKELEKSEKLEDSREKRHRDGVRRMLRVTVMGNTLGILREQKYESTDQERTQVKLESLSPLITVIYKHESKLDYSSEKPFPLQTPYKLTQVRVVNEDCLIVYDKLASDRKRPVLLNMANAFTPGGGYRKGDNAQEENIFRRSNYCVSLDPDLDPQLQKTYGSKVYYCDDHGERKEMRKDQSMYPMDEYGAIFTTGILVFRDTEKEKGYCLLSKPIHNVSAIALAAYRDPDVTKENCLTRKFAVRTRKKIENLFSIALVNGYDTLVLSALGCGAFKNPPKHIALIFKSVILQFAGFFKEIVFSIIDDHNTGNHLNPNGNFAPFQDVLDNLIVSPPSTQVKGMTIGPYLISEMKRSGKILVSEILINTIPPCDYATSCNRQNDQQHLRDFSHPPKCPFGSECTETKDDVHLSCFIHPQHCREGGQCVKEDERHLSDFDHPNFCSDEGNCTNMTLSHLNQYRHVPLCQHGLDCDELLRKSAAHIQKLRHCRKACRFGGNCINFHDLKHIRAETHPFKDPCPLTPYACVSYVRYLQREEKSDQDEFKDIENHCLRYAHVCPWGRQCNDSSEKHLEVSIHIAREMCPNSKNCTEMMNDEHLNAFTHPGIRDIR
ncbi:unnamed protein product [Rotaria magnacalcarata]|uniref:Microbial-type PARG catalytic domain-containing protein n=1 Tax=Rotaria magnacalcarata TaxID=392030 RepID=A0A816ZD58_9BILA|nr:unnamed protein product [Rotaria magnacalcarata]CAF3905955.1 unnamed protein product [Rotaria magnacalcarata]